MIPPPDVAEPSRICVLGAGRGSAELVDFLRETSVDEIVVLDDLHPNGPRDVAGAPVVGTLDDAASHAGRGFRLLSGIASSKRMGIRAEIRSRLALPDDAWGTFIHPLAHVSLRARIAPGAVVYPNASVAVDATLGPQALVYYAAVVHHDCVVDEGAILCAGVLLAGGVHVGAGAYLGIGSVVREGVTIGPGALVGMGAVVTRDVPPGAVVRGVPARG